MAISFQSNLKFDLDQKRILKSWIKNIIEQYSLKIGNINYLFTNDDFIKELNVKYLNHNYFTDILTFDYSSGNVISGDIVISIETVKSNSIIFSTTFKDELHRVMIHGVLHMIGFNDETLEEKLLMREREEEALKILNLHE
jgi:rRNA maturation RNase YbeY